MKMHQNNRQSWAKARAPYLVFALGTACPQLPEPMLDYGKAANIPAPLEYCIQTNWNSGQSTWKATLQDQDSLWQGPEHGWSGEIGTLFQNDLETLREAVNATRNPFWKQPWFWTVLWAIPLVGQGIYSLRSGNLHTSQQNILEATP